MSSRDLPAAAWPWIEAGVLVSRIAGLAAGERPTIVGVDRDGIGELLSDKPGQIRGALLVGGCGFSSAPAILGRRLDDLALAC